MENNVKGTKYISADYFYFNIKRTTKTLNKLDYQNIFVLGFTPFLTSNDGIILIFSTEI